jgi:hypothetical protein
MYSIEPHEEVFYTFDKSKLLGTKKYQQTKEPYKKVFLGTLRKGLP